MKLFAVYNGYVGHSSVFMVVVAENESRAAIIAAEAFKEEARNKSYKRELKRAIRYRLKRPKKYLYPSSYWSDLQIETVFSELETEQASEVFE